MRSENRQPGKKALLRPALRWGALAATAGFFAAAVLEHPDPLVMAVGLAPLALLALEAVWRLLDDQSRSASASELAAAGNFPNEVC